MKPVFSLTITIILAAIISTNAQITFSRDWFAGSGKRSGSPMVLHKPQKRRNENLDMIRTIPVAHIQPNPIKKTFSENGPGLATGNHIQDLNRAIQYLQNLKNGLLTEEYDDLEAEVQHAVDEHLKEMPKENFEPYVPKSFRRI